MKRFKFNLNDTVFIGDGKESGRVIGRAEYVADENAYFVRYVAGNGCATERWWAESALKLDAFGEVDDAA